MSGGASRERSRRTSESFPGKGGGQEFSALRFREARALAGSPCRDGGGCQRFPVTLSDMIIPPRSRRRRMRSATFVRRTSEAARARARKHHSKIMKRSTSCRVPSPSLLLPPAPPPSRPGSVRFRTEMKRMSALLRRAASEGNDQFVGYPSLA